MTVNIYNDCNCYEKYFLNNANTQNQDRLNLVDSLLVRENHALEICTTELSS